MLPWLVILNSTAQTYLQSLKKDLAKSGFEIIILNASISWIGAPVILAIVFLLGKFQMPTEPIFYLLWFGVAAVTVAQFTLFVLGLQRSIFLAANTFSSLSFATVALYAALFLHESISLVQGVAIGIALVGALLFFQWKRVAENKGLVLIVFSLFLAPFGSIFYKAASLHTSSYTQFLTGRLVMDFIYYSFFLCLIFAFWFRTNPFPKIKTFICSWSGFVYMVGWAATNLLDSWLIFSLPISLFAILDTVSIPASYAVGKYKYRERIESRHVVGTILIIVAIIVFALSKS